MRSDRSMVKTGKDSTRLIQGVQMFKIAGVLLFILVSLQSVYAYSEAEMMYLSRIDRLLRTGNFYGASKLNIALTSREKLVYGYQVCEALKQGAAFSELTNFDAINSSDVPPEDVASIISYRLFMETAAVFSLCPEYKPSIPSRQ